jgi:hypothetical protein
MQHTIAILGEAEKGKFNIPHFPKDLSQLIDCLGNPPAESCGLYFAIQALLFQRNLIYCRVEEEGFSDRDYFAGLKMLRKLPNDLIFHALCLPGVGDPKILDASKAVCQMHNSFLITTPKDLQDYLTSVS